MVVYLARSLLLQVYCAMSQLFEVQLPSVAEYTGSWLLSYLPWQFFGVRWLALCAADSPGCWLHTLVAQSVEPSG